MIGMLLVLAVAGIQTLPAQVIRMQDAAAGKLLVAQRELPDPNFAGTVIVLLEYSRKGAMGLVLNRPTDLPVSRVFREMDAAKARTDILFSGGPVERGVVHALQRSKTKIEEARLVVDDVYVVSAAEQIEKSFRAGVPASELRFYAGYAGWGPGQLDREIDLGAWVLMEADAATIFHAKPEELWRRLIRRSESRLADRNGFCQPPATSIRAGLNPCSSNLKLDPAPCDSASSVGLLPQKADSADNW
jgi:putative transcriptional regulator